MTARIDRSDLQRIPGMTPKLVAFFEHLFTTGQSTAKTADGAVAATGAIQEATVLTLSPNAAFDNERVLVLDTAQFSVTDTGPGGELQVSLVHLIVLNGSFACSLNLAADTNIDLPTSGRVPSSDVGPYADDAAAATAGVQIGDWYAKTGGTVVWRVA